MIGNTKMDLIVGITNPTTTTILKLINPMNTIYLAETYSACHAPDNEFIELEYKSNNLKNIGLAKPSYTNYDFYHPFDNRNAQRSSFALEYERSSAK